jgi:AraC family carnitine catabolism transcriptional activator
VAIACGFGSYEHFCRCYRREFGVPPSRDRRASAA